MAPRPPMTFASITYVGRLVEQRWNGGLLVKRPCKTEGPATAPFFIQVYGFGLA